MEWIKKIFNGIILILILILISCSEMTKTDYELKSRFNSSSRESILYLMKNDTKTDSLIVGDWYGKDSIQKIDENHWKYFYSQRCGSGCSIRNQILLKIENSKLKKLYDGLAYYTYYSSEIDSATNSVKNKLTEYDSVNLTKEDTVWYINQIKFSEGEILKSHKKLIRGQ